MLLQYPSLETIRNDQHPCCTCISNKLLGVYLSILLWLLFHIYVKSDQMKAKMGGLAVDINTHIVNSSHSGLYGHVKDSSDVKVSFFMHRYLFFLISPCIKNRILNSFSL